MDLNVRGGHAGVTPPEESTVTAQIQTATAATPVAHAALVDQVLSTHRTARGTSTYVRCTCGGFVILGVDGRGETRQMGHAAGRLSA